MSEKQMKDESNRPLTKADLDGIEARLFGLDSLSARLAARLDDHDERFIRIDNNLYRLNVGFARMEGRMSDMEGKMDSLMTLKIDFARFQTVLDGMARNQEIFLRRWAHHDDMLMDHERRLGKLESRPQ